MDYGIMGIELGDRATDEMHAESIIEIRALLGQRFHGARFTFAPNVPSPADRYVVNGWTLSRPFALRESTVYACEGCVHGEHDANCAGLG